jgi:threonine/homoserine/homoserine lactone efflux protein
MSSTLSAFLVFAIVGSFTPGHNNLLLAASGANFGWRRTLAHMFGVILGFPLLFFAVGAGLGEVFSSYPFLHTALRVIGSLYLAWLAWRIAFAPARLGDSATARPLNFWQAAAFQWVNPKAWLMTITAIGVYAAGNAHYYQQILWMTLIALAVSAGSSATWTLSGVGIRRLFTDRPHMLRAFNIFMGVLLLASLLPIVFNEGHRG